MPDAHWQNFLEVCIDAAKVNIGLRPVATNYRLFLHFWVKCLASRCASHVTPGADTLLFVPAVYRHRDQRVLDDVRTPASILYDNISFNCKNATGTFSTTACRCSARLLLSPHLEPKSCM